MAVEAETRANVVPSSIRADLSDLAPTQGQSTLKR
jgi:hypothetical protein